MGYLESIMGAEEHVVFATKRHWLLIAGTVITSAILSIIIIVAAVALIERTDDRSLILLLLLIVPIGRLAARYLDWWNEQFIVTNRRIIQIGGVFNKHVIDSSLEKVNDVVMDQTMMGRLLGYGNIEILTASDIGVNKLEKISDPIKFKKTMLDQKENMGVSSEDIAHHPGHTPSGQKTIPELINDLAGLRDRGVLTDAEFQAKKSDLMSRL